MGRGGGGAGKIGQRRQKVTPTHIPIWWRYWPDRIGRGKGGRRELLEWGRK
jgi:hypothetical protein